MRPILLAAALALAAPAAAQDAAETPAPEAPEATAPATDEPAAAEPSEEARAAAERYVQSEAMQVMLDEMVSPDVMTEALTAQFGDEIPQDVMSQIVAIATEEMQAIEPAMEEAMIEATAETFTVEEIEAQIEFYESEVGASILSKMQPFMSAFYEAAGPEMQTAQRRMMERLQETLPAE